MLELYNSTNNTRTVPKFRYNGKVTLNPKGTMDIEDYMASFYKPYSSIGVLVRVKSVDKSGEGSLDIESGSDDKPIESVEKVTEDTVSVVENTSEDSDSTQVEEVLDSGEGSLNIGSDSNDKVEESNNSDITKDSLMEKKMKDLREMATSMGLGNGGVISKESLCDLILESVNK